MKWKVSDPFAETALESSIEISSSHKEDLGWTVLKSEPTGLANLSRVSVLSRETNTVFARVTVVSDHAQSKTLAFGYSDRLRLFFNDRLLYTGNNGYRTRDYRYLGTIGYFDAITLPLEEGRNELWFAVSESFGGWGVQAACVYSRLHGATHHRPRADPVVRSPNPVRWTESDHFRG
jgi:hypothetical protein